MLRCKALKGRQLAACAVSRLAVGCEGKPRADALG